MEPDGHHKRRDLKYRRIREDAMTADYDRFSRQFKKSRELPFRTCIEEFMGFVPKTVSPWERVW